MARIDFMELAKAFDLSEERLFEQMTGFNDARKGSEKLSQRSIEKMRAEGVSGRVARTRNWTFDFFDHMRGAGQDLSEEALQAFVDMLQDKTPVDGKAKSKPKEVLDRDADRFFWSLYERMGENAQLREAREDYSGFYWIIRQSTEVGKSHFYKEPFYFGEEGRQAWLIPNDQSLARGFSFASVGVGSAVMEFRHSVRDIGVRFIMLYGDSNPSAERMTGVMLRFSDDVHRPVASRILAIRVEDQALTDIWIDAVKSMSDALISEDRGAIKEMSQRLNGYAKIVSQDDDPDEFSDYESYDLEKHAKAMKSGDFAAVVSGSSIDPMTDD